MLSGSLLADAVTWLFTSVLKGLQTHGQHDGCMASLVHLAFQIYEALVSGGHGGGMAAASLLSTLNQGICQMANATRKVGGAGNGKRWVSDLHLHQGSLIPTSQRPRYLEIRAVMEQIPEIQKDSLDQFDCKLLNPSLQKVADKRRKDQFKRLIAGCIGVGHMTSLMLPAQLGCPYVYRPIRSHLVAMGHGGGVI